MVASLYYQAMPDNCRLLAKSKHDLSFGSYLEKCLFLRELGSLTSTGIAEDRTLTDFIAEMRCLVEEHPWIEERNLNLGRNWDVLHFLISAKRRGEISNGYIDWTDRGINGGDELHKEIKTGIGTSIKYLPPSEVSYISSELSNIPMESLTLNWHPDKMKESDVYRPFVLNETEFFDDICRDLKRLQTFYAVVSKYGEGILTFAV